MDLNERRDGNLNIARPAYFKMTETSKLKLQKQILTCGSTMNQSSLSHSLQQRACTSGMENLQPNMMTMVAIKQNTQSKTKKKVFEYRGSNELAVR